MRCLPVWHSGPSPRGLRGLIVVPQTVSRPVARVRYPCQCRRASGVTAGCPSGQRERSVKPSAQPTLVRTQHPPPPHRTAPDQHEHGPGVVLLSFWHRQSDAAEGSPQPPFAGYTRDEHRDIPAGHWRHEKGLRDDPRPSTYATITRPERPRSCGWPSPLDRRCTSRGPSAVHPRCDRPAARPPVAGTPEFSHNDTAACRRS